MLVSPGWYLYPPPYSALTLGCKRGVPPSEWSESGADSLIVRCKASWGV